jgi:hypothetical protein
MEQNQNYSKMTTEALQELLRQDCADEIAIDLEDVLEICDTLSKRNPLPQKTDEEAYARFLKYYLPEVEGNIPEDDE